MRGSRVLVTGATGFLGARQVAALRGWVELHAVSRSAAPEREGVRYWQADLSDRNATRAIFEHARPDYVLHMAGFASGHQGVENLYPSVMDNVAATVNLLEAAVEHGCGRFITVGSLEEAAEDAAGPSPYAVSKAAAHEYAELCRRRYGLPVTRARVFMAYGPGQRATKFLPQLIASLGAGTPFEIRSGDREVDWIYADDVTEAILLTAAAAGVEGSTLDVGSGELVTIRDVARMAARAMDREELLSEGPPDREDERVRAADAAETERAIGWRPKVSLEEGLRRTVAQTTGVEAIA
jgi:nucleoside-diphosphate-sugar epimerase